MTSPAMAQGKHTTVQRTRNNTLNIHNLARTRRWRPQRPQAASRGGVKVD